MKNKQNEKTFFYGSHNRLLSITYPDQTQETYTYDNNGNPITKTTPEGITYYTYDNEDRLIQVAKPDNTIIKYTYDSYGKLIKKEKNNTITTYHYDTGLSKEVTPNSTIYYEHNSNGELISLTLNNQTYFYHFNNHGDTIALSDTNQNIVATYQYDPYGNLINEYNPQNIPNPYLYTGAFSVRYDKDIDLYLMTTRYYSPKTGRFITKDKYPPEISNPLTFNSYIYCGNDPINKIDPKGNRWWRVCVANLSWYNFTQSITKQKDNQKSLALMFTSLLTAALSKYIPDNAILKAIIHLVGAFIGNFLVKLGFKDIDDFINKITKLAAEKKVFEANIEVSIYIRYDDQKDLYTIEFVWGGYDVFGEWQTIYSVTLPYHPGLSANLETLFLLLTFYSSEYNDIPINERIILHVFPTFPINIIP